MLEQITKQTCRVECAVLHVLDRGADRPTLTDDALELDDELRGIIVEYIVENLPVCRVGRFRERDVNVVRLCCDDIVSDREQLVPLSKTLAQRLFDHMGRGNIKSGPLCVVVFGHRDEPEHYVALIKMDNTPAITYQPTAGAAGHRIKVSIDPHGLPEPKNIDKVAFILPRSDSAQPYELRFRDRIRTDRGVAKYFQEFLNCDSPQSDKEKTRIFDHEVERWIQTQRDRLPDSLQEQQLREAKHACLRNNTVVNVREFAQATLGDRYPELQESLIQYLRDKRLYDPEFEVDVPPDTTRKITYRLTIGSDTIDIRATSRVMDTAIEIEHPTPGQPHYVIKITADDIKEVAR
jgi:hypothetical protein